MDLQVLGSGKKSAASREGAGEGFLSSVHPDVIRGTRRKVVEVEQSGGEDAEEGEERIVQLSRDKMIWVIGEQLEGVVKSSRAKSIPLVEIEAEFKNTLGHSIPMEKLGVFHVQSLMELLQSWVRTVETKEGILVVTVDRGEGT